MSITPSPTPWARWANVAASTAGRRCTTPRRRSCIVVSGSPTAMRKRRCRKRRRNVLWWWNKENESSLKDFQTQQQNFPKKEGGEKVSCIFNGRLGIWLTVTFWVTCINLHPLFCFVVRRLQVPPLSLLFCCLRWPFRCVSILNCLESALYSTARSRCTNSGCWDSWCVPMRKGHRDEYVFNVF